MTAQESVDAGLLGASVSTAVNPYETAADEAAAALVDIGRASSITVDEYEASVPPTLAAASALLDELSSSQGPDMGVLSAAYVALSSDATLSLTLG
ncbi:MAG TPA: hypothetical protein VME01_08680 [Solirubrobacteraceae bacterium]|nr:hypothetical protein [Solirubrobacteraceae bacterium]